MLYKIKVIKKPESHDSRKKNADYISRRGSYCSEENAGLYKKASAERWIRVYKERKGDGYEFTLIPVEQKSDKSYEIRAELLPS